MDIEIVFDTEGAAVAGVDRNALIANLQAELDKLAAAAKVAPPIPDKAPPPPGAQGDAALIHWLLHVAAEPTMARAYAQGLLMAINALVSAVHPKAAGEEKTEKKPVRIKVFAKEIALPVATSVIKAFLDSTGMGSSGS